MIRARWSSRAGRGGVLNRENTERASSDLMRELLAGPDLTGAACTETDPDLWYPDQGGSTKIAKTLCRGGVYRGHRLPPCPVRAACLARALDEPTAVTEYGTWAGYTAPKLRRMRQLRAALRRICPPSTDEEG